MSQNIIETLTEKEVAELDAGKCPDCGSEQFYHGPQGGMNTNIRCANDNCRAEFNVVFGMAGSFGKERLERPIVPTEDPAFGHNDQALRPAGNQTKLVKI